MDHMKNLISDKRKWDFFQAMNILVLMYGCTIWTLTKPMDKRLDGKQQKNEKYCSEQILGAELYKTAAIRPLASHLTNHPSNTSWELFKKWEKNWKWCSMDTPAWTTNKNLHSSALCRPWMQSRGPIKIMMMRRMMIMIIDSQWILRYHHWKGNVWYVKQITGIFPRYWVIPLDNYDNNYSINLYNFI